MDLRRLLFVLTLPLLLWPSAGLAGVTERVSISSSGEEGNDSSVVEGWGDSPTAVSADGRFVVFSSSASNLVPGDGNEAQDVFVHDRHTGATELVSTDTAGQQGNNWSYGGSVSEDGQYIAFLSEADNLVSADLNECPDVFVRDRIAGHTSLISVAATEGEQANGQSSLPSISADGRYVAFASEATNLTSEGTGGVFVRDRQEETTELASIASSGDPIAGHSYHASISRNGQFVVFTSDDSSVVDEDYNDCDDVFVHDRLAGTTERVSLGSGGEEASGDSFFPSISADGRFVAFVSWGDNLVPGDTNGWPDIFLRDRQLGTTQRVNVGPAGEEANSASSFPSISADGRFVAFWSGADNLVAGHMGWLEDVFIWDRWEAGVELVSASSENEQADRWTSSPSISANGRFIAFFSWASNLTADDTNDCSDVFIRDQFAFRDVPAEHWAFDEVAACSGGGIVAGYPDGAYYPEYTVSRDQMAVYIARALAGGDSSVPDGPYTPSFWDVNTYHWAYDHVEYALEMGVVQGYPAGDYRPGFPVDRGQMAVYIARSMAGGEAGIPEASYPPTFPDVDPNGEWYWCHKHVEYIADAGVASGYEDGKYHPEYICSRDQMAVFIQRAFDLPM